MIDSSDDSDPHKPIQRRAHILYMYYGFMRKAHLGYAFHGLNVSNKEKFEAMRDYFRLENFGEKNEFFGILNSILKICEEKNLYELNDKNFFKSLYEYCNEEANEFIEQAEWQQAQTRKLIEIEKAITRALAEISD